MCIVACIYLFSLLIKITLIMLKEIRNCRFLEGLIKRKRNEKREKKLEKDDKCEGSLL